MVLIGIVAVVVGLGSILGAASRGVFGGLATKSASHATGGQDSAIAVAEVFLF